MLQYAPEPERKLPTKNWRRIFKKEITFKGITICVEREKGELKRRYCSNGASRWVKLTATYGNIKEFRKARENWLEVLVGEHTYSGKVFIISQTKYADASFDKYVVALGFSSKVRALRAYNRAFNPHKKPSRVGSVHQMHIAAFKDWVYYNERAKSINEYVFTKIDARAAHFINDAVVNPYENSVDRCWDCVAYRPGKNYKATCDVVDIEVFGNECCSYFLPRKAPFRFWEEKAPD